MFVPELVQDFVPSLMQLIYEWLHSLEPLVRFLLEGIKPLYCVLQLLGIVVHPLGVVVNLLGDVVDRVGKLRYFLYHHGCEPIPCILIPWICDVFGSP